MVLFDGSGSASASLRTVAASIIAPGKLLGQRRGGDRPLGGVHDRSTSARKPMELRRARRPIARARTHTRRASSSSDLRRAKAPAVGGKSKARLRQRDIVRA